MNMRRKILATAAPLLVAGSLAAVPAAASAAPIHHPEVIASCEAGGPGVTYSGSLIRILVSSPEGPVNNILGGENFVIDCPPISGSVTIELQYRVGKVWTKADDSRYDFPAPAGIRGFSLKVGPYYCQGTKTSWRIAIFSSGIAGDGTPWGPATDFDSAIGGSSGKYFNCG